jgi:hypothetical protein
MYFLLLPENEHEVDEWKDYWEGKVDEVWVWKPHNWGGHIKVKNISNAKSLQTSATTHSCGRPFLNDLCVKVNGELTVCCFDPFCALSIGNLYDNSLQDMLRDSAKYNEILQIHRHNSFESSTLICKDCDQIYD